jgi:hypothetical protein
MEWIDTKVQFEPWCGDQYEAGISGLRVLILGESHYHLCDEDKECDEEETRVLRHRSLTRDTVKFWKDHPHSSPVSYRVPGLFGMNKDRFWNSVIFYNYLQTFAGPGAKHRPKEEQWDDGSAEAFQSVLDTFQPDRILVLGMDTWRNLPSDPRILFRAPVPEARLQVQNNIGRKNAVDAMAYWYSSRSGKLALAMPVYHPSAVIFSSVDWTSYIDDWMKITLSIA